MVRAVSGSDSIATVLVRSVRGEVGMLECRHVSVKRPVVGKYDRFRMLECFCNFVSVLGSRSASPERIFRVFIYNVRFVGRR